MMERFLISDLIQTSRVLCGLAGVYPRLIGGGEIDPECDGVRSFRGEVIAWNDRIWRAAQLVASMHGISQVLDKIYTIISDLPADDSFRRRLADQTRLNSMRVQIQAEECIRMVEAARTKDIETIVLKGMSPAHRLYDEPGRRPMADVDLLVRPEELFPAAHAIVSSGFDLVDRSEKHMVFSPVDNQGYPHIWSDHPDNRRSVEVHDALYYDPLKVRVTMTEDVWDRKQTMLIHGHSVWRLGDGDAVILCALDIADSLFSKTLRFIKLIDLVMLSEAVEDCSVLTEMIVGQGRRIARYSYPAFVLGGKACGSSACTRIADLLAPQVSRALRKAMNETALSHFSYAHPIPSFLGRFEGLRLSSGLDERMSVLKNLLVPEREWDHGGYFENGKRNWRKHYSRMVRKMTSKTKRGLGSKNSAEVLELHDFR